MQMLENFWLRILQNKWPYWEVVSSLQGHSTEGPADCLILKQHVQDTFQLEESGTGLLSPNMNYEAKEQLNSLSSLPSLLPWFTLYPPPTPSYPPRKTEHWLRDCQAKLTLAPTGGPAWHRWQQFGKFTAFGAEALMFLLHCNLFLIFGQIYNAGIPWKVYTLTLWQLTPEAKEKNR